MTPPGRGGVGWMAEREGGSLKGKENISAYHVQNNFTARQGGVNSNYRMVNVKVS